MVLDKTVTSTIFIWEPLVSLAEIELTAASSG